MRHFKVELDFIPIGERLPDVGRDVFAVTPEGVRRCRYLGASGGLSGTMKQWERVNAAVWYNIHAVTHWAEIPVLSEEG